MILIHYYIYQLYKHIADPVESTVVDNTITCNEHLTLESGIRKPNQVNQTGEDPTKDKGRIGLIHFLKYNAVFYRHYFIY